jgi:hypothetical protein
MRMTLSKRFFRHFALALATAQLVALTGAPVLEGAMAVAQVGAAHAVDGKTPEQGVPFHDPSTCVVCQLISSVAPPPQPATILAPADEASGREVHAVAFPRQDPRREGVRSRAPPAIPD